MTYVKLKDGRLIKVKNIEPDILGSKFPESLNVINGITFYENYITFTDEYNDELFVPMNSVLYIDFKKELEDADYESENEDKDALSQLKGEIGRWQK